MDSEHLSLIRQKAMWLHISGLFCILAGCVVPIVSLLIPYLYAHSSQKDDPFIAETGRNVTNYHLSIAVYSTIVALVFGLITFSFCDGWFQTILTNSDKLTPRQRFAGDIVTSSFFLSAFFAFLQAFSGICYGIYGARKALQGYAYRYPFTIDFLKDS
jgi:uncharacterized Tic20 family protein